MSQPRGLLMLITRPEHDAATRYLSCWSEEIIKQSLKKNISVVDLHRDKSTRHQFEGRVKKLKPSIILLNGHGNENEVTGHDNKSLVKLGDNEGLLKNRITYAVSCDSAKRLGKKCADNKTTFIGYKEKFIFNYSQKLIIFREIREFPS